MLDMLVGLGLAFAMMVYYRYPATSGILLLPVFALYGAMAASGVGCLLAAVNVQYRDVKYVVPFLVQMGMFITPVIYPISYMPAKWRPLLALNPMTGVVLGFRYSILGMPLDWPIFVVSLSSATVICFIGLVVFRRMEVSFGDVI